MVEAIQYSTQVSFYSHFLSFIFQVLRLKTVVLMLLVDMPVLVHESTNKSSK